MKRGMYARPKTAAGYRVRTRVDGKQSRRCNQETLTVDVSLHTRSPGKVIATTGICSSNRFKSIFNTKNDVH